jgi:hypothetical protein
MVQAILEGRKTMTRRVVKSKMPIMAISPNGQSAMGEDGRTVWQLKSPYGKPGDVLWVRETWMPSANDVYVHFKADCSIGEAGIGWKPSIHMPKAYARIWLRITSIGVQRLHDISEQDAIAEGCIQYEAETDWMTARYGFEVLWQQINGPESWTANPWVWVVEFERIEEPENA